jgi:hypothetical protein
MTSKEQIVIYNKIRYLAMQRLKNEFYYEYRKFYKEEAEKLQAIEKELK